MSDSMEVNEVNRVLNLLSHLDNSFVRNGISSHFIQIKSDRNFNEIQISGNVAGLVHIAKKVLEVASKNVEGAHHQFDEAGLVDHCEIPVVVSLTRAEWD